MQWLQQPPEYTGVPDDYVYSYIRHTPSEWKHLGSSSGPTLKRTAEVAILPDNPIHSSLAMGRVSSNGESVSHRQHLAAIKKSKEEETQSNKENQEIMAETLAARNRGCAALEVDNVECRELSVQKKSIVQFNTRIAKRKQKIESLEKMLLIDLGDRAKTRAAFCFS